MSKEEKVIYIKGWLQRFGDRDNETFNIQLKDWSLSIQYRYDLEGYEIDEGDWCCSGFKHVHNNSISDRSDEELDVIIGELKSIKQRR